MTSSRCSTKRWRASSLDSAFEVPRRGAVGVTEGARSLTSSRRSASIPRALRGNETTETVNHSTASLTFSVCGPAPHDHRSEAARHRWCRGKPAKTAPSLAEAPSWRKLGVGARPLLPTPRMVNGTVHQLSSREPSRTKHALAHVTPQARITSLGSPSFVPAIAPGWRRRPHGLLGGRTGSRHAGFDGLSLTGHDGPVACSSSVRTLTSGSGSAPRARSAQLWLACEKAVVEHLATGVQPASRHREEVPAPRTHKRHIHWQREEARCT